MKIEIKKWSFLVVVFGFLQSCNRTKDVFPQPENASNSVAVKWADMLISFIKVQPLRSPTFISRGIGYCGLTMYESIVAGSNTYKSIAPALNGLGTLPTPALAQKVDWETSMNAAQSLIIRKIWQHSPQNNIVQLDSLEDAIFKARTLAVNDTAIINYSKKYGISIANQIYDWSVNDNGHLGYLNNFDPSYIFPVGPQYWTPPTNGQVSSPYPMSPHWGMNRTFVKANASLATPTKTAFSLDANSDCYKMFKNVYDISKTLTAEQKEISNWWADDPSYTAAPAGHSFNLAKQLVVLKSLNLVESAQTFAKVGLSVADAFVCCWKVKYTFHSIRPSEYARESFDPNFYQYWPEPPFPAFPSGHSTQAGAASTALISVFGDVVTFTDHTHDDLVRNDLYGINYKSRSYTSLWAMAQECGISRVYGGIHTNEDNEQGLALGKTLATNIVNLPWKK